MKTSWGDISVADAHVHFFSHIFFSTLAAQRGGSGADDVAAGVQEITRILAWTAPPEDPGELAQIWTRELDRHGVDRAALIASVTCDEASAAAATARFPD